MVIEPDLISTQVLSFYKGGPRFFKISNRIGYHSLPVLLFEMLDSGVSEA